MEVDISLCDNMESNMDQDSISLVDQDTGDDNEESHEDAEDNDEDQDIIEIHHVINDRILVGFIKSQPWSVCLYLIISIVILCSVITLVVVSMLVVVPYHNTSGFIKSTCEPVHMERDNVDRKCTCGKACHSQYPCVRIMVNVQSTIEGFMPWTAILAEDETMLGREVIQIWLFMF